MHRTFRHLHRRLREENGNAVAEFPLVAALVAAVALSVIQVALYVHVRNGLTDAAVQSAYHAALQGNDVSDGIARARDITDRRFASFVTPTVTGSVTNGIVEIEISTNVPLVGFLGPANGLVVTGHAVKEESL